MINYIHEPTPLQCGQAVLAMLCNITVDEVVNTLNNEKETKEFEDKIHKMKDELGICPICGKKFD
jgi:hypothetical protein